MKVAVVAISMLMLSKGVSAAGWTGELTLLSVATEPVSDMVYFYTTEGAVYAPGCQQNAWMMPADTDSRRARGYAALMTALASGKKVKLWFSDTCGTWGFHSASAIQVMGW